MSKNNVWITKRGRGWVVKTEDGQSDSEVFSTQSAAINNGRQVAINNESELIITGMSGKIRDKINYGKEPSFSISKA